jgi:hypothetical protein
VYDGRNEEGESCRLFIWRNLKLLYSCIYSEAFCQLLVRERVERSSRNPGHILVALSSISPVFVPTNIFCLTDVKEHIWRCGETAYLARIIQAE